MLADIAQAQLRTERMARAVPLEAPWTARRAAAHEAGAETATRWNGYMDGAVRSGHDVAQVLLAG